MLMSMSRALDTTNFFISPLAFVTSLVDCETHSFIAKYFASLRREQKFFSVTLWQTKTLFFWLFVQRKSKCRLVSSRLSERAFSTVFDSEETTDKFFEPLFLHSANGYPHDIVVFPLLTLSKDRHLSTNSSRREVFCPMGRSRWNRSTRVQFGRTTMNTFRAEHNVHYGSCEIHDWRLQISTTEYACRKVF